eukprot:TRINITY_DN263_c0_g1_i6.p1 TRINITY_DN263_c0_g1~~TRINITY_DN263_c0_g1_i6.p1  ORF type:complete len:412 (-),score=124.31 TRINITY_DN263_c0_g1_i6:124-1359(-)
MMPATAMSNNALDFLFDSPSAAPQLPVSVISTSIPPSSPAPQSPAPTISLAHSMQSPQTTSIQHINPAATSLWATSAPATTQTPPSSADQSLNVQNLQFGRLLQMLETLNTTTAQILHRVEGMDGRLSTLEGSMKEVLTHQRSMQMQLKDDRKSSISAPIPVSTPAPAPTPAPVPAPAPVVASMPVPSPVGPMHHMPVGFAPAPPYLSYPAPMPMHMGMMPHMPQLVPVTHIKQDSDHRSGGAGGDSDAELARKLQASFDAETSPAAARASNNVRSAPPPPRANPSSGGPLQECPVCQLKLPQEELNTHVELHFAEQDGDHPAGATGKDGKDSKPGFFSKLFNKDDKSGATATPAPATPAPSVSKPAATTQPARTVAATPQYRPSASNQTYGYPGTMQPPQQYMYYPQLDH